MVAAASGCGDSKPIYIIWPIASASTSLTAGARWESRRMPAYRASIAAIGFLLATAIPTCAQKCEGACLSACEDSTLHQRMEMLSVCDNSNASQTEKTRCLADAHARNRDVRSWGVHHRGAGSHSAISHSPLRSGPREGRLGPCRALASNGPKSGPLDDQQTGQRP